MDRLWRSNPSISSRTGSPLGIVNDEDHNVESCGATVLMCLHGTKSKNFKNNILSMADVSLNDQDRKSTRLNSSHQHRSRMPSSA